MIGFFHGHSNRKSDSDEKVRYNLFNSYEYKFIHNSYGHRN